MAYVSFINFIFLVSCLSLFLHCFLFYVLTVYISLGSASLTFFVIVVSEEYMDHSCWNGSTLAFRIEEEKKAM